MEIIRLLLKKWSQENWLQMLLVILWIVLNVWIWWDTPGDDLSATYIAANLLQEHKTASVYSHDPIAFDIVNNYDWKSVARRTYFTGFMHPFVHTPLVASVSQPLAARLNFPNFKHFILILDVLSLVSFIILVIKIWLPYFYKPLPLAISLGLFAISEPVRYSLYLVQTQPIILIMIVIAIIAAMRKKSIIAGVLLALATIVKITPAIIALYWLFTERKKAALSFLISTIILICLSILINGVEIHIYYLHRMTELSNSALAAFNNQSFAGWVLRLFQPSSAAFNWDIYQIPASFSLLCYGAIATIFGVILVCFKKLQNHIPFQTLECVCFALLFVVTTIFVPIAWTHYFIVWPLLAIALLLAFKNDWYRYVLVAAVVSLNFFPFSTDAVRIAGNPFTIISSHYYSACITIVALLIFLVANTVLIRKPKRL